jgi:hypothetical protein
MELHFKDRLLALTANIRLDLKKLAVANTHNLTNISVLKTTL